MTRRRLTVRWTIDPSLLDPSSGLFAQPFFLAALSWRVIACRRVLRPLALRAARGRRRAAGRARGPVGPPGGHRDDPRHAAHVRRRSPPARRHLRADARGHPRGRRGVGGGATASLPGHPPGRTGAACRCRLLSRATRSRPPTSCSPRRLPSPAPASGPRTASRWRRRRRFRRRPPAASSSEPLLVRLRRAHCWLGDRRGRITSAGGGLRRSLCPPRPPPSPRGHASTTPSACTSTPPPRPASAHSASSAPRLLPGHRTAPGVC